MSPSHTLEALAFAVALGAPAAPSTAQTRDPTRAPESALTAAEAASAIGSGTGAGASAAPAAAAPLQHRMVIDGKPYLVERGWLRGVGDSVAGARIERITEREVWLREGGTLHKWPLYPDVQILHPAPARGAASSPAARGHTNQNRSAAASAHITAPSAAPKDTPP